jgi:hypothetical protein
LYSAPLAGILSGTLLKKLLLVLTLAAVAFASRLPQLRSPNLLVDGDESVLGLMAKHVAEAKEFPIFFYGQNYAFSPVEEVAGAISFLPFGVRPLALKVAALGLWIAGLLFGFLALSRLIGCQRSFWIALLLVLNPVWAVFSLKAGGGYLTAFAATNLLCWLLTGDCERETTSRWIIAGLLTSVIDLAQPLWLPGVLIIVIAALARRPNLRWTIGYIVTAVGGVIAVKSAAPFVPDGWSGPALGNGDLAGSLLPVGRQIYIYLTGAYYLAWPTDSPGLATTSLAMVWCALFGTVVALQAFRLVTRRHYWLSHLLFASICATIGAEWLVLAARDPRYLLPLGGLLVPLLGIEVVDLVDRNLLPRTPVIVLTAVLLLLGAKSMREFREFNYLWKNPSQRWTEARRLQQVINYLKVMDVRRVFSMNGLLDFQLIFYSDEQVLSRWTNPVGRYHRYVAEVNRALAAGERVAVVGYTDNSGAPGCWDVPICTGSIESIASPASIFTVDDKYFVYVGADRALLTRLGFRFWD